MYTFWLSIFELTDLSGMWLCLGLFTAPGKICMNSYNNYREPDVSFSTIACVCIHMVAHSLTLNFFFWAPGTVS